MWQEFKTIKSSHAELRSFGFTLGLTLMAIGGFLLWRSGGGQYLAGAGIAFVAAGLLFPKVLLPLQKTSMAIGIVLGWIMTRVTLAVAFFFILTPLALLARLVGKKFLELEFRDPSYKSYWRPREPSSSAGYEKQF